MRNGLGLWCIVLVVATALTSGAFVPGPGPQPGADAAQTPGITGQPSPQPIVDPQLLDAMARLPQGLEFIVTGPPHDLVLPDDRQEAMQEMEQQAASFVDQISHAARLHDAHVIATWPAAPAVKLQGDAALVETLRAMPAVRHLTLDHDAALRVLETTDETGLLNTGGRAMMDTGTVWDAGFHGEGIVVSVVDTGVDDAHEAFRYENGTSRIAAWADCTSGGCSTTATPYDDHGHGTHVAGTTAGSSAYDDPDWGTYEEAGVAPEATLHAAKFLDAGGGGSWGAAMDALQWSFDSGADVTVNSWGGGCSSSASVIQLVEQLADLGMVSVFAAGNSGPGSQTIGGPACGIASLSVGAVDSDGVVAGFSSRGPCKDPRPGHQWRTCPDLAAKGVFVRSAVPRDSGALSDPSGYKWLSGTSMATPFVAGAVVLAEQMKRHYTGSGWDTERRDEWAVQKACADGHENNQTGWGIPDLACIHTLLRAGPEPVLAADLAISLADVDPGEATTLRFSVEHDAGAVPEGVLRIILEHPDGSTETRHETSLQMGLFERVAIEDTYTFHHDSLPGEHRYTARFAYSWTNDTTQETEHGTIEETAVFEVHRPHLEFALAGLAASTTTGTPQSLTFSAHNTGTRTAAQTGLQFTLPMAYPFLGDDDAPPGDVNGHYAQPAPDTIQYDFVRQRITLHWDIGTLPAGADFTFETRLLATTPGTHTFTAETTYVDGPLFTQHTTHKQTVQPL